MTDPLAGLRPMLATASGLPPRASQYAFEYKWDGMRALVHCKQGRTRLMSRNGNDATARFPEFRAMAQALGREALLDGEIVLLDAAGRPDFGALQQRMALADAREAARKAAVAPCRFFAFDLLQLDGELVVELPYAERRRLLLDLGLDGEAWSTPPAHVGEGEAMLEVSRELGLEGVVAKRLDSPYAAGRRSPAWLKVRNKMRQEFVIGGWSEGEGSRGLTVGSLLLGYYDGRRLVYVGRVGAGFTSAELDRVLGKLKAKAAPHNPFGAIPQDVRGIKAVHWVKPELVCEVEFGAVTQHGTLRHASYKGLRSDKKARDVVWEQAGIPAPSHDGPSGHGPRAGDLDGRRAADAAAREARDDTGVVA